MAEGAETDLVAYYYERYMDTAQGDRCEMLAKRLNEQFDDCERDERLMAVVLDEVFHGETKDEDNKLRNLIGMFWAACEVRRKMDEIVEVARSAN